MFLFRNTRKAPRSRRVSTISHPRQWNRLKRLSGGDAIVIILQYLLLKDIQEVNRLDFQHFLLRQVLKGHYVAPVEEASKILDVACGTGRWMLDVGQEFPEAQVTGIDIEVPAVASQLDSRYQFQQANILKGLSFPDKYSSLCINVFL